LHSSYKFNHRDRLERRVYFCRSDPDLESVYKSIERVPTYRWGFYKNPDYMRTLRERASAIFFSDFQTNPKRYVAGDLPRLPFVEDEFDVTLVSCLLFAYQDRFDCEFHRDSVLEIMRVTQGEAGNYPTVTFEAQPSEYIPVLKSDPALKHFEFKEIETDFEFLVNSNSYLRVTRA